MFDVAFIFIGMFVVIAEPTVHVLTKQVEEITSGSITKRAMLVSLSCGVGISVGLAMIRVLTGIPVWYFLIPGYSIAIVLSHFVPKIFTAIIRFNLHNRRKKKKVTNIYCYRNSKR